MWYERNQLYSLLPYTYLDDSYAFLLNILKIAEKISTLNGLICFCMEFYVIFLNLWMLHCTRDEIKLNSFEIKLNSEHTK